MSAVSPRPSALTDILPAQVPLFKSTQYFANVLELADVIVALIYEQLPSQSLKPRSGQTFGSLTDMTELSIAKSWSLQYKTVTAPDTKLSLSGRRYMTQSIPAYTIGGNPALLSTSFTGTFSSRQSMKRTMTRRSMSFCSFSLI